MSYRNLGDNRLHTTGREKLEHAGRIVAFAQSLLREGHEADAEVCNECVAQEIMLALSELAGQVANGDRIEEKFGLAERYADFALDSRDIAGALERTARREYRWAA